MSKIKFFLQSVYQSAVKPDYYTEVIKAGLSSSVKYLSLLVLTTTFFSLIIPLMASAWTLPEKISEIENAYPENLEVKLEKGQVSTNQSEPYYLVNNTDGVIVIDTTGNLENLPDMKAGVLITRNKIITRDTNGIEERSYNLSSFEKSITVNRELVSSLLQKLKPLVFPIILLGGILLYPFIFSSVLLFDLIYIFFINFIPFFLSRILNLGFSFKNLLKISIHAYTFPFLLQFLVSKILKITFPPFSFTLIYLAFTTTVLVRLNKK